MPTECEACGKTADKYRMNTHHWKYAHKTSEVRKNPNLATHNTSVLCFTCHRVGDALRTVFEHPTLVEKLKKIREESLNGRNNRPENK